MEIVGVIRWIALGVFVVFFYLSEVKKKEEFKIPSHIAILVAILLHALVRDWHLILKIIIGVFAVIGIGGNILNMFQKRIDRVL